MLNRSTVPAVLLLACCAFVLAQDAAPEVKMPPMIEQADARYDEAVKQAQAVRMRVYEKAMQDATRAGNLELATAIKERMGEPPVKEVAFKPSIRIAGTRWSLDSKPSVWIEFMPNGMIKTFADGDGGLWRDNGDGTVSTLYDAGLAAQVQTFKFSPKGVAESSKPSQPSPRTWTMKQ